MGNQMQSANNNKQLEPSGEVSPANITQLAAGEWALGGSWTARGLDTIPQQLDQLPSGAGRVVLRGEKLDGLDSAGAWVLQRWLSRQKATAELEDWAPRLQRLMEMVAGRAATELPPAPKQLLLERVGRSASATAEQTLAMLTFVGETSAAAGRQLLHTGRIRWRILLRNIQIGGFNALPIIGLTSFLLGVVVAYQGADQLKNYGANIFVVDLVGYAMLREFAPLITAIIIAGRSGSAYTAEIGTMVITEEIDALRTIGIDPIDFLVLPKIAALVIALPLLTVFADITGVFGGMVMARSQLGVGFHEFVDRFGREMHGATLLVGIGKSVVFALIISGIGCFQGFRTRGSADSVGRQTTMSVVQSIFLVIVADALFSVVFNMLDI
jgi:phospholipid/cholesterol/gamma-HCH transport system permease protein